MRPASVGFQCPDDAHEGAKSIRQPRTSVGAVVGAGKPVVTYVLIALNLLIYFICAAQAQSFADPSRASLFGDWQMVPAFVHYNHDYYRLISSAFLHYSPMHIAANMLSLFIIGPPLERLLGRWRFSAIYLLSGFGGGVAIYLWGNALGPVAGASGAIFGLFGACLIMVRRLGLDLMWLASTVVLNFVLTFSLAGISRLGHLGGFVTGVVAALAVGGLPSVQKRIPTAYQALGLGAIFVLLCLAVAVRSNMAMPLPVVVQ
jgi:membrane associated rhomboid family serine protease